MSSWLCSQCHNNEEVRCYDGHDKKCRRCCGCKVVPVELSINVIKYIQSLVMLDYAKSNGHDDNESFKELLNTLKDATPKPL